MSMAVPFMTVADPLVSGEGALDPLGLSGIGDRLADEILPGLRARMSRVRFVTAIAVAAAVCEGLEEEVAADGVTPAAVVFEWLLVDAFARADRELVRRTPGIDKARGAREAGVAMSARTYLKTPNVFGYHGVYKPLARHLGIVDEDLRLGENGYSLLDTWEREQGVSGFIHRSAAGQNGNSFRSTLRSALDEAMRVGYSTRSAGWQGWTFFLEHLLPSKIGGREAALLDRLLKEAKGSGTRGEVFALVDLLGEGDMSEQAMVEAIRPRASSDLKDRLLRIRAYEKFCAHLETGFDSLRWLSSTRSAQAVGADDFAGMIDVQRAAQRLERGISDVRRALDAAPASITTDFDRLAEYFENCHTPQEFYHCLLARHAAVQRQKPPDGKREWFEHGADEKVMVRVPYRTEEAADPEQGWPRPYRLYSARQFTFDLREALRG